VGVLLLLFTDTPMVTVLSAAWALGLHNLGTEADAQPGAQPLVS